MPLTIISSGCQKPVISILTAMPLDTALSNGYMTLAEFSSSSCDPCREMIPILEDLANLYTDRLNVVIVDVYEQEKLASKYSIIGTPTQVIFDTQGKEVARHIGAWSLNSMVAQLRALGLP
ncbi:MAG: thioredoxin domain-containing protein [Dehalogenimonas sp.]